MAISESLKQLFASHEKAFSALDFQKIGANPKIILFVAHQDEQKAMKELGLT